MKRRDFGESMCDETKLKVLNFVELQLRLHNASQQRELLIAYNLDFYKGIHDVTLEHIEQKVDKYLSNL
jgi:hypothetical protein